MTNFKCKTCEAHWTEGATRDYREDQECRYCLGSKGEITQAFYTTAMDRAEKLEAKVIGLEDLVIAALPYVESAESSEGYKPGSVTRLVKLMRLAAH